MLLLEGLIIFPHILCFISSSAYAAAGPIFLITSPMDIRPGVNLTLGIEMLQESPPLVKVVAQLQKDEHTLLEGESFFKRGGFGTLVLPQLPLNSVNGKYELNVKGYSEENLIFFNKTSLEFKSKGFSVFIETNSVFYKPGQEVKIRILAFSFHMKPYKSTVDIYILDPQGNLIEQWLEEEMELGVVSQSLYLSDNPPLGDWTIKVKLHQQLHYQTFTVMEQVLPRFEVLLNTTLYHSIKNPHLEGTVTAKYTYGMPVKGKLSVMLSHNSIYKKKTNITKDFVINGCARFSFSNVELKELMKNADYGSNKVTGPVDIDVNVKESLTGITQNVTTSVFVIDKEYNIEFLDHPTVLKPMLNFTIRLQIVRYDGRKLTAEERDNEVAVTVTQTRRFNFRDNSVELNATENESEDNVEMIQLTRYTVPKNGIICIEIPLLADIMHLYIKAEFLDAKNNLFINDLFSSLNGTYIQIKKADQDLKVGIPYTLSVDGSFPLKDISYLVVSKGQIVAGGKGNPKNITLNPENTWTPEVCLIVYHVANDGTVTNDVTAVSVQPIFENKVYISWNTTQARPADMVSLNVNVAEPNSLVVLSVIDKRVKLLGDRQEISTANVLKELKSYSTSHIQHYTNPSEVFEMCNIGVMTDANIEVHDHFDILFESGFDIPVQGALPVNFGSPRIRSLFPETWIWKHLKTGSTTHMTLDLKVPDVITTWITSAYVISENFGFGMLAPPEQLEAFQPFFLSLNLPSYVIRGEQFVLEVIVFNYLQKETEVSVTLEKSDAFEIQLAFVNASESQQSVSVPSQEGKIVFFPIKPIHLGEIPITVKAISALASDAVTQKLQVKAEGVQQSHSQTLLLDLMGNKPKSISQTLNFTFPPDVVSGSEKAFITVVGDHLGLSIRSIKSLIQMPYGCGEQNMIRFAPNIFIMEYLSRTKQLNEDVAHKLISFIKNGYQRQLVYQREDGSFSAFGNKDPFGSTWLSAFVLQCFLKARPFILVDPVVLHNTLTWLLKHQRKNGEFWEPGTVIYSQIQGGHHSAITLTAYIMAALIEYPGLKNSSQVAAATDYLESQMDEIISDNYTLSLVTYALSLVGRSKATEGLDLLNMRAEQEGQLRFWRSSISSCQHPCSTDIVISAYALLSYVVQNRIAEGMAVMKWLSQQRSHLGGFSSTQDTIIALQAMSSFASVYTINKQILAITVDSHPLNSTATFQIDSNNRILLQTKQLAVQQQMNLTVHAEGTGFAILQFHTIYNLKNSVPGRYKSISSQDAFDLGITVLDNKDNLNVVSLNICTRSIPRDGSTQTGMVLMQVDLLSGFSLVPEGIPMKYPIKKVDYNEGKINIYLDSLNQTEVCINIPATRDFKVGYTQEAFVYVIDYYDPGQRAIRSYNSEVMQQVSPCSFCNDDCNQCITGNHALRTEQTLFINYLFIILLLFQVMLL
ncbi:CD109 antigen [Xenopus tropicalis]|uniref:CD109 antigen n=1 Tax=Xenopus tropicalis TaxID=8364 RepID=A0A6I8PMF1_XENTR|nr:CD109 antigen [Xenopus tropicalis]